MGHEAEGEVYPSISAMMEAAAETARKLAESRFGFALDFSEASLAHLDPILAQVSASGDVDEERETKLWGAYLGETLRRLHGGAWDFTQYPGSAVAMPTVVIHGSQIYPLMKVYRRLHMGETERVDAFYAKVRERLLAGRSAGEAR